MINETYGDDLVGSNMYCNWFVNFKNGEFYLVDKPRRVDSYNLEAMIFKLFLDDDSI